MHEAEYMLYSRLASTFYKRRVALGLTQAQLAAQLDWPQSKVCRYEDPTAAKMKLFEVVELIEALGLEGRHITGNFKVDWTERTVT